MGGMDALVSVHAGKVCWTCVLTTQPLFINRNVQARGVKEFEYALLANLMPETAEEAMALIPTLRVSVPRFHVIIGLCDTSDIYDSTRLQPTY